MTTDDLIHKLYMKHPTWVLMAERMLPVYSVRTGEDIVQDMYLKIYQKLKEKKLKPQSILIDDKIKFSYIYIVIQNLVNDIYGVNNKKIITYPIAKHKDVVDEKTESDAAFYEKIDKVVENFQWFHKKLFKLYTKEFYSMRKLEKETKISYKTIWRTVKECKQEIRNKLKNGN